MENPETTAQWGRKTKPRNLQCVSLRNNAVLKCHYQINSIASFLCARHPNPWEILETQRRLRGPEQQYFGCGKAYLKADWRLDSRLWGWNKNVKLWLAKRNHIFSFSLPGCITKGNSIKATSYRRDKNKIVSKMSAETDCRAWSQKLSRPKKARIAPKQTHMIKNINRFKSVG